jgi:uncharacterized protein
MGGTTYVLGFALAEILRKYHPWLRAEAVETRGADANVAAVATDTARRKDTLINSQEISNALAREGREPFKTSYTGSRAVSLMTYTNQPYVTLDKNIKTKDDLVGKRLMTMRPGTVNPKLNEVMFRDVWGILDKLKVSVGDFEGMKNALQDGLVDVACLPISGFQGTFFEPTPALNELMTMKPTYFINLPPDDVRKLAEKAKLPVIPSTVPPGSIGPKQLEPIQCFSMSMSWWADEQMDDEVVYEITKTIYDFADKFEEYAGTLGKFINKKTVAMINAPEELFHRGALKFYKEKGVKVGLDPKGGLQ